MQMAYNLLGNVKSDGSGSGITWKAGTLEHAGSESGRNYSGCAILYYTGNVQIYKKSCTKASIS
jgi:hypothetical protein